MRPLLRTDTLAAPITHPYNVLRHGCHGASCGAETHRLRARVATAHERAARGRDDGCGRRRRLGKGFVGDGVATIRRGRRGRGTVAVGPEGSADGGVRRGILGSVLQFAMVTARTDGGVQVGGSWGSWVGCSSWARWGEGSMPWLRSALDR